MASDPCGARLPDPITPSFVHVCSRVDDHSCSPKWQHWDHVTDMTWLSADQDSLFGAVS